MKPPEYLFTRETKETRATTVNFNPFRLSLYVSARVSSASLINFSHGYLFIFFFFKYFRYRDDRKELFNTRRDQFQGQ